MKRLVRVWVQYACCACYAACYPRVCDAWCDTSQLKNHIWNMLHLPLCVKWFSQKLCNVNVVSSVEFAIKPRWWFHGVYFGFYLPIYFCAFGRALTIVCLEIFFRLLLIHCIAQLYTQLLSWRQWNLMNETQVTDCLLNNAYLLRISISCSFLSLSKRSEIIRYMGFKWSILCLHCFVVARYIILFFIVC